MMDGSSPAPKSHRGRRWLRRGIYFVGWLGCVLLCFGLLALAGLWLVAKNPVIAVNTAADLAAPHLGIRVESVEVTNSNTLEVRGLVVHPLGVGEAVRIERAEVKYSLGAGSIWEIRETGSIHSLSIDGAKLAINDALLAEFSKDPSRAALEESPAPAPALPDWLQRVVPESVQVTGVEVALDLKGLPKLETRVEFESGELHSLLAAEDGEHHLRLLDGRWLGDGGKVPVGFDSLDVAVRIAGDLQSIAVTDGALTGLRATLTPEDLAPFSKSEKEGGKSPQLPALAIESFTVTDAQLDLSQFGSLPAVSATAGLELGGLHYADGQLSSSQSQQASLREVSVVAPGAGELPVGKWSQLDVGLVPDAFFDGGWIEQVHLRGAEIYVNQASLGDYLSLITGKEKPDAVASIESGPDAPDGAVLPAFKVRDLKLEPMVVSFDPDGVMAGLPAVRGVLQARSEGEAPADDIAYVVDFTGIEARETVGSTKAFGNGKSIAAEFTALGLQQRGEIAKVTIGGIRVEVGDEVRRLVEALPAKPPTEPTAKSVPDETPSPGELAGDLLPIPENGGPLGLSIVELEIDDTVIALKDLIPDVLPRLPISIDTKLTDVPLIGRSRGDEREQRIEIKGVQIASPYNTLQNVAELKTVWLHFTMAGLLRSEIRRIEVVSPDLYVGEPLFWYIDHVRKFSEDGGDEVVASGDEVVASGDEVVASGDEVVASAEAVPPPAADPEPAADPVGGETDDAIVKGLKDFELAGWKIGSFEAHSGRIIIAPTGVPLGIVPFPFNAKTDFAEGKVEVNVGVPTGDYTFESLELEFEQLEGEAFVNYPASSKDNNFVQTFKAPRVKFKQFEAQDVWLSVTYDQAGIYGQLGGNAYEGYVNGEFNLYIAGPYNWDAWVSGEKFNLGSFTDVLAPEQFMMSGALNGKVVADGQELNVNKVSATADCGTGTMHVLKLDDLRESLPEEWDPLWKALTNAGIDAFRDYHFDKGSAELNYAGKEGVARLQFDGDEGKRDLLLRLFDGDKASAVADRGER